jgi:hypothetical protein
MKKDNKPNEQGTGEYFAKDQIGNLVRFKSDSPIGEKLEKGEYTLLLNMDSEFVPPFFAPLISVLSKTQIGKIYVGKSSMGFVLYSKSKLRNFNKKLFIGILESVVYGKDKGLA